MIRIWNVKIKAVSERRKGIANTIAIEEEKHELIVWKQWITLFPKLDFFHHIILRQNLYNLMDTLLKIGTYSICMKREDKTHLYSANIIGISPYMLENITGYERHSILAKLQDLADLGYISFTAPTRGEYSEMNILLNEYSKAMLRVYQIEERTWLNEKLLVEKESLFGEYNDIRNTAGLLNSLSDTQSHTNGQLVATIPIIAEKDVVDNSQSTVATIPIKKSKQPVDNMPPLVKSPLIRTVNLIDDFAVPDADYEWSFLNATEEFKGVVKDFFDELRQFVNGEKNPPHTPPRLASLSSLASINGPDTRLGPNYYQYNHNSPYGSLYTGSSWGCGGKKTTPPTQASTASPDNNQTNVFQQQVNIEQLPTSTRVVAMIYQQETGLKLTEQDVWCIIELLKISAIPQIVGAIQSSKVWRATLPSNFDKLSEEEKKIRIQESQPGFFLKVMGMRHVYNFVRNSPRYRKDMRKAKTTGVVSGLDRKRALARQTKIIQEIREKNKKTKEDKNDVGK